MHEDVGREGPKAQARDGCEASQEGWWAVKTPTLEQAFLLALQSASPAAQGDLFEERPRPVEAPAPPSLVEIRLRERGIDEGDFHALDLFDSLHAIAWTWADERVGRDEVLRTIVPAELVDEIVRRAKGAYLSKCPSQGPSHVLTIGELVATRSGAPMRLLGMVPPKKSDSTTGIILPAEAIWEMGLALDAITADAVRIVVPPVGGGRG